MKKPRENSAGTGHRVLAVIVNYFSAQMAVEAARSVLADKRPRDTDLALVVSDNSQSPDQARYLKEHLPKGAELMVNPENLGFGRACNLACKGFDGDFLLLVNPDARLLPGAFDRLLKTMVHHPGAGAVSPRIFWDDACLFQLPLAFPSPGLQVKFSRFGNTDRLSGRLLSGMWRKYSAKAVANLHLC